MMGIFLVILWIFLVIIVVDILAYGLLAIVIILFVAMILEIINRL